MVAALAGDQINATTFGFQLYYSSRAWMLSPMLGHDHRRGSWETELTRRRRDFSPEQGRRVSSRRWPAAQACWIAC